MIDSILQGGYDMSNNDAYMIPLGNVFGIDEQEIFLSKKQLLEYQTNKSVLTGTVVDTVRLAEILRRKRTADEIVLKANLETRAQLLRQDLTTYCSGTGSPELMKSVIQSHIKCMQLCCIPLYARLCAMQYLEQLFHNSPDAERTTKSFITFSNIEEKLISAWSWAVNQYYERQEILQNSLTTMIGDGTKTLEEIFDQIVSTINRSYSGLSDTAYQMKIQGQLTYISLTGRDSYTYICNHSDTSCSWCAALHTEIFAVEDGVVGVNLPPIHPNCRCEIQGYPALPEDMSTFDIIDLIGWEVFNRSVDSAWELLEIPLDFVFDGISALWKFGFMDGLQDSYGAYGNIEIDGTQYAWNEHTFSAVAIDPTGVIIKSENLLQYDVEMLELMRQRDELPVGDSRRIEIEAEVDRLDKLDDLSDEELLSVNSSHAYAYYVLGGDITEQLNSLMAQIKEDYVYMHERTWMENLWEFKNLVQNDSIFDLKNQPEWKHSAFIYEGELVDQDALGNINYGFFGAYCNIPDSMLLIGAGYAQISAGTTDISYWATLFDDPRDTYRVLQGSELYRDWYK